MYDLDEEASWLYSTLVQKKRVGISLTCCIKEIDVDNVFGNPSVLRIMSYRIDVLSGQLQVAMTDE
jgi:hypothetical protein